MVRFLLLFTLQLPFWVLSQTIRNVDFVGLTRTNQEFLQHVLLTKTGAELDTLHLNEDIRFLKNLPQFSGIAFQINLMDDSVDVRFTVTENYTILPSFGVGLIEDAPFIQVGINDYNLLGRMAQLSVNYTWYDRHSFQIFYHSRFIGKSDFGLSSNLEKRSTLEPIYVSDTTYDYLTDKYVAELLPGYNLNRFIYLQTGVALILEKYTIADIPAISGTGLPVEVDTTKWLFKGVVTADRRIYQNQYVGGWASQLFLEGLPKGSDPQAFIKIFNESRWYTFQNKWNYAGRLRMGVATNTATPFPPFVVDSYINLRGSGNRIARGSAEFTINQEIRYTLYEKPWGAVQGVAFIDAGSWRPAGGDWDDLIDTEFMLAFGGLGARLHLQKFYNLFLRADYGVNPIQLNQQGLVLGVGQYF